MSKGGKREGAGRPKGSQNKNTGRIREAFNALVENNLENMTKWLEEVAEKNPSKALDHINALSEYILPKLQRTELTGDKDKPIIWQEMKSYDDTNKETD